MKAMLSLPVSQSVSQSVVQQMKASPRILTRDLFPFSFLIMQVVYLYDIRMGTVISKLRQGVHDIVGDVCFHPIYPQLVAATYDGKLRFFSS